MVPMRPILRTVNSYNTFLSEYLIKSLKPFADCSFCVKDTFTFATEVSKLRNNDKSRASFDIVSLFTNIPVSETVYIIKGKHTVKFWVQKIVLAW